MKTFLKPIWWIFVFLIPQILLFLYESSIYAIVKTELPEENLWPSLAGIQLFIFLGAFGYIGFRFIKHKNMHWIFPVILLITESSMIAGFFAFERDLIPWSIPRWMIDQDEFSLLFVACTMPSLFFSILQLVSYSIKEEGKSYLRESIAFTLIVPLLWYLYVAIAPAFYTYENQELRKIMEHMLMVLAIITIVVFFFFLIRILILIGRMMMDKSWVRIVSVTICCLIAPLVGLFFNNIKMDQVFGDFSHWSFYALTIVNAGVLLIPPVKEKTLERILVALRFFTIPFSLYFLIVFVPFLPLSIAAIIAAGMGILLLAPVLNFIIHVYRIYTDLNNQEIFPTNPLRWLVALPAVILPFGIHLNYQLDRWDLDKALGWIYHPNYTERSIEVDPKRISYVLDVISNTGGSRNRGLFSGRKYWKPYLSSYYRWLVLDNLTLSGRKLADLERTFVGTCYYCFAENPVQESSPEVSSRILNSATLLDGSEAFYRTTLHFELENQSDQQQEFIRRFTLPEGAWISDYYLNIGDKVEHGILAEKRTAQWVYRNIVNRRRDPGIISYTNGNEVELRVFPMEAKEKRRTGFEIIHTGSLHIPELNLSIPIDRPSSKATSGASVPLITQDDKSKLSSIVRKKKYYVLIDNSTSVTNPEEKRKLLDRVQLDLKLLLSADGPVDIFAVNYKADLLGLKAWRPALEGKTPEGGFFADRIMKSILAEHYTKASELVPVFLIYSNRNGSLSVNLADLAFTSPDIDRFFISGEENSFVNFYNKTMDSTTQGNSAAKLAIDHQPKRVKLWNGPSGKKWILPEEGPSIVLTEEKFMNLDEKDLLWRKAATQHGNVRYLQLHPELSEEYWRPLVGQNFETGILSPYTSYLVVETEAQKEVLRQKQKEVLNAAQYFDLEQEFISMAEPDWGWYLLGLGLMAMIVRKRVQLIS